MIAFLTVRSDFAHDRYDATLRAMDASGGGARVLVSGMRGLDMPRWSPDGRTLAFIAEVGGRKPQILLVRATGGPPRASSAWT